MTFSEMNLDPSIIKAIEACGYTTPTPVQLQAIPKVLRGEDLIACAPTGTGKTAAFVLPALNRLCGAQDVRKPRVLVLTPTRELATQITQAAAKYGKFIRFNMASLVGGMPYRQQLRDLSRSVDMIVATPGRLLDHMENRRIDLSGIEMLVLDEADRMLDMGFIDDVQAISKATPSNRQTLLFSATVDGKLGQIVKDLLKNPARVDLSQEHMSPAQIKQELYLTDSAQHKARLLQHFLDNGNIFKGIIFTATKIGADKLANELDRQGYASAALHGDLKQSQRNRTIEQMRRGKIQFLVATDVAARGIDISDMTHVINYDLPRFCEDYVHRIGRTGRAGKTGIAISFALQSDSIHVKRIEKYIGENLNILMIEGLEPVNKHLNPNPPKSGRGRKSGGGFGGKSSSARRFGDKKEERSRPSRDRSDFRDAREPSRSRPPLRSERSDRPEFARSKPAFGEGGGRERSESTGSRGRSSDRSESGGRGRSSFGGSSDRKEPSRGRSSFGDSSERREPSRTRSSFGDSSERREPSRGRPSFGGSSDRKEPSRGRSSFGDSSERREPSRGRSSFGDSAERREPSRARSSFGGSVDRKEPGRGRSSFGDSSDRKESGRARPSFGGSADRKEPGRGRSSFGGSSERKESGRGKPSFSGDRSERSGRSAPKSGAPRSAGARPAGPAKKGPSAARGAKRDY